MVPRIRLDKATLNRELLCCLCIFSVPFLIYWSIVAFPYLLKDDNWLVRGWAESGYPSARFISVLQGRPLLAASAWMGHLLFEHFGEFGIQLIRITSIILFSSALVILYFALACLHSRRVVRLAVVVVWASLPPAQIVMANGAWIAVGIVFAMLAALTASRQLSAYTFTMGALYSVLACATYQPLLLLGALLGTLIAANAVIREKAGLGQFVARILPFMAGFAFYMLAWMLLYSWLFGEMKEGRYSPTSVSLLSLLDKSLTFYSFRFWNLFRGWDVTFAGSPLASYGLWIFVLLIASMFVAARALNRPGSHRKMTQLLLLSCLCLAFVLLADFFALLAPGSIKSYITQLGPSLFFCISVVAAFLAFCELTKISIQVATSLLLSIALLGMVLASANVTKTLVIPTWLDTHRLVSYVTDLLARQDALSDRIVLCIVGKENDENQLEPKIAPFVQEFNWSNITSFYAYWNIRSLLDMMGRPDLTEELVLFVPETGAVEHINQGQGKSETCPHDRILDFTGTTKAELLGPVRKPSTESGK